MCFWGLTCGTIRFNTEIVLFKHFKYLLCPGNHDLGESCEPCDVDTVTLVCPPWDNFSEEGHLLSIFMNGDIVVLGTFIFAGEFHQLVIVRCEERFRPHPFFI